MFWNDFSEMENFGMNLGQIRSESRERIADELKWEELKTGQILRTIFWGHQLAFLFVSIVSILMYNIKKSKWKRKRSIIFCMCQ